MAKRIMQFRYYNKDNTKNQPADISLSKLNSGEIFKDYTPFTQLGIQTLPGVRFYLNNNKEAPIIIGSTGIYELELEGISEIEDLRFDLASLDNVENNGNAYLIIDVISDQV